MICHRSPASSPPLEKTSAYGASLFVFNGNDFQRTGVVVSALTYFINPMLLRANGSVYFDFTLVLVEVLFFAANCLKLRHFISFLVSFSQEASPFSAVLCPRTIKRGKICSSPLSDCHTC